MSDYENGSGDNVMTMCYIDKENFDAAHHPHMANFDFEKFSAELLTQCQGEVFCNPKMSEEFFVPAKNA